MKKLFLAIIILFIFVSSAIAEEIYPRDTYISVGKINITDDDSWESGIALRIRVTRWVAKGVGIATNVGIEKYDLVEDSIPYFLPDVGENGHFGFKGSAYVLPIGLSLVLRSEHESNIKLDYIGSIYYAFVHSDSKLFIKSTSVYEEASLGYGNNVLISAGATLHMLVGERSTMHFGVEYRHDLKRGDVTVEGFTFAENEIKGFSFWVGFGF